MPRASRLPPKLITATSTLRKPTPVPHAPRLWNAKRRIPVSVGLKRKDLSRINDNPHIFFQRALRFAGPSTSEASKIQDRYLKFKAAEPPENLEWWQQDSSRVLQFMENHPLYSKLSSDVRTFIAANPHLSFDRITTLIKNPSAYFRRSHNVPFEDRVQVHFPNPNDHVVLIRTPKLSPYYACFEVPLHFNKLDMRDYLKSLYNVDSVHIRSYIHQTKDEQVRTLSKFGPPRLVRKPNIKKMTVQLARPFVYPEEITDLNAWEHDEYWRGQIEFRKEMQRQNGTQQRPDIAHRRAVRVQTRELLASKDKAAWEPTWKILDENVRIMDDALMAPPPSPKPQIQLAQKRRHPRRKLGTVPS